MSEHELDNTLPASGDGGELAPGAVVDHYQIERSLGAGGMGVVYLAEDTRLARPVALKLLRTRAPVGSDVCRDLCARLLREARAMAQLSHPNLISVHDVGTFAGRVYVAMEYVDGWTLRAWSEAEARSVSERLAVLLAAGRGLAAAHSSGVVHRDFKPDNVLVARSGRVLVGDFGLARSPGDPAEHCAVVGTPPYMAPELHRGEPATTRSDQFAFAVTAWEILVGRYPFPGRTAGELARAIAAGDVVDPPASTDVPLRVSAVLRRDLRADPRERHESLAALLDDLEAAAARRRGLFRRRR